MDKPAKATPAARKRVTAAKPAAPRKRTPKPPPVEAVEPPPAAAGTTKEPRRRFLPIAGFSIVAAAAVGAALLLAGQEDVPPADFAAPATVSARELASFASSQGAPVYWGGERPARTIELRTTATGTFVRYLPAGAPVGGSSRALTIATYPMRDAYGTAVRRAKGAGMASSRSAGGGLAVWSTAQPTSVYVAFPGVPSLIEVYAPQAKEARTLALSGRLRPVR
jgi:hypothetical protein